MAPAPEGANVQLIGGSNMGIFPSEVIGTAVLILLGDGVVAAVLLAAARMRQAKGASHG